MMVPTSWRSRENETQGRMAVHVQGPKNTGWLSPRWDKTTETSLTNRLSTLLYQTLAEAMVK